MDRTPAQGRAVLPLAYLAGRVGHLGLDYSMLFRGPKCANSTASY